MLHADTTIELAKGQYLQIGFVMCFTDPRVQITTHVRKGAERKHEVDSAVSFDATHLEAVIAALEKVRDALPRKA